MAFNPGRLRHFINIQQVTRQRDAESGEFTDSWSTLYENIDAAIEDQSVRAYLQSKADQSEVTTRITIRQLPNIDGTFRFVGVCGCHEDVVYNPAGPGLGDPDSGLEYLTFPCSRGVNDG